MKECPRHCWCYLKVAAHRLKTCYDAQNDAMLDDDSTLQKPYKIPSGLEEGNMMVRGEGDDIWYRTALEAINTRDDGRPSLNSRNVSCLPLFRFNQS
ncbi:hypothetical protein ACNKHU_17100 [Shigella flexneri]